jgi:hypothetical protein
VEIKYQLDATDEFLLQILLLTHVSGTIMPIIRSSRVLYKWLLPVVFGAWFSSCRYGVELRVVCPVCGQHICNKNSSVASSWHFISTYYSTYFGRFLRPSSGVLKNCSSSLWCMVRGNRTATEIQFFPASICYMNMIYLMTI